VAVIGTLVLFAEFGRRFIFISEQFWGRAARASGDSQESGRPLIFEAISIARNRMPIAFKFPGGSRTLRSAGVPPTRWAGSARHGMGQVQRWLKMLIESIESRW
jgi:hypothetical protein